MASIGYPTGSIPARPLSAQSARKTLPRHPITDYVTDTLRGNRKQWMRYLLFITYSFYTVILLKFLSPMCMYQKFQTVRYISILQCYTVATSSIRTKQMKYVTFVTFLRLSVNQKLIKYLFHQRFLLVLLSLKFTVCRCIQRPVYPL